MTVRVYDVITKCGKGAVMVSVMGSDPDEARETCRQKFGENFKDVREREQKGQKAYRDNADDD